MLATLLGLEELIDQGPWLAGFVVHLFHAVADPEVDDEFRIDVVDMQRVFAACEADPFSVRDFYLDKEPLLHRHS